MPMKRTRVGTENELPLLAPAAKQPPPHCQTKVEESADGNDRLKLGEFLKRCYYCKKSIPAGVEVFMYRDFCGFCSVGCRDIQISLDKLAEKQVPSSNVKVDQCQGVADVKSQHR